MCSPWCSWALVHRTGSGILNPVYEDRGIDSTADIRILTRLLFAGLVALVITAFVLFLITRNWIYVVLLIVPYAIVSATQWYAAHRRAEENGAAGEF